MPRAQPFRATVQRRSAATDAFLTPEECHALKDFPTDAEAAGNLCLTPSELREAMVIALAERFDRLVGDEHAGPRNPDIALQWAEDMVADGAIRTDRHG